MIGPTLPFHDSPLHLQLVNYPNTPEPGAFFVYAGETYVRGLYICRETTSGFMSGETHQIGYHRMAGLDLKLIDQCFEQIETRLGLTDRTIIHPVDYQIIVPPPPGQIDLLGQLVVPMGQPTKRSDTSKTGQFVIMTLSPFWYESGARRAFFTLFLRLAAVYYRGDLDDAMARYDLLMTIKTAVDWFLKGNTHCAFNVSSNLCGLFSRPDIRDSVSLYLTKGPCPIIAYPAAPMPFREALAQVNQAERDARPGNLIDVLNQIAGAAPVPIGTHRIDPAAPVIWPQPIDPQINTRYASFFSSASASSSTS